MPKRIERVNELIKREISKIILREIEFPKDVLATVTRAETLLNLMECKVFISAVPEEKINQVLKIVNYQVFYLQQKINKKLNMRPVPKIIFFQEKKTAEAGRIEEILGRLKK